MADFRYTQIFNYAVAGGGLTGVLDIGSNWPDWDNDDIFEIGDAGLTTGPYVGFDLLP